MSYPIRAGIWFQNEEDFNKVAADMKDRLDRIDKDRYFIHWETYGHHDIWVFKGIAEKYPEITCMGYSQYCGMGGASGLSITVNRGHVDIQEYEYYDDFSDEDLTYTEEEVKEHVEQAKEFVKKYPIENPF